MPVVDRNRLAGQIGDRRDVRTRHKNGNQKVRLIDAISPDVLVKGADYTADQVVGGDLVKARGGRVVLIPLVDGRSSTRIVERMRR
jgi:bifunctional ADP-heptose synthase (sugar kinase/adenylyltransferase)